MLGEEEKNAALSDKKKRMWVHKCFGNKVRMRIQDCVQIIS